MSRAANSSRDKFLGRAPEPESLARRSWAERRRDLPTRDALAHRVLSEFREMPCLRVTPEQAQRLFGLQPDVSRRVIGTLIEEGHLRLDPDGRYVATKG